MNRLWFMENDLYMNNSTNEGHIKGVNNKLYKILLRLLWIIDWIILAMLWCGYKNRTWIENLHITRTSQQKKKNIELSMRQNRMCFCIFFYEAVKRKHL